MTIQIFYNGGQKNKKERGFSFFLFFLYLFFY